LELRRTTKIMFLFTLALVFTSNLPSYDSLVNLVSASLKSLVYLLPPMIWNRLLTNVVI
jgi:hypothetical protein